MPITEDQIKFYLSGGSNNSDVFASIGGPISNTTQIRQDEFNNLWGDLGALDLKIGSVQYRAVYMKNESNNTVFENPRAWFAIKDTYVSIQFTKLGVNKRVASLPNERTAPPNSEVGAGGPLAATRHIYPSANVTAIGSIGINIPANANDQDNTTGWLYSAAPAWLRVDLGASKNIDYVAIRWFRNTVNASDSTFNVETSTDGTNWTNRFSGVHHITAISEGPNVTNTVPITPTTARYVRVNITASTNPIHEVGIVEFEVWGIPDVAPTIEPTAAPETVSRISYPSENVTANGSKAGTSPANTNDNLSSTGWLYSPPPAWLNVDLGVTKYLYHVRLTWAMSTLKDYSVTFNIATSSDNASFTTRFTGSQLITGRGSPEERVFQTYTFERHNARYVRVNIVSTDRETGEVGIGEFEVYGVSEKLAIDVGGWEGATEDLATTQSACPHVPPLSYIGLWLRRVIPPNDLAFPTLKQTMKLEVVGGGGTLPPTTEPPPVEPPPTEPPPTEPPPGGGGGTGTGPYPGTGKQLGATTRRDTRHYQSGKPDDETIEKNTKSIPYAHYQCVYYVTVHGIEHDDNVSSKLGGTHMGTGWLDHGVSFNSGRCCLGTEPNHPDTNACIKTGANIGSIVGKRIGIATIWRKPTKHTELWTRLPGGNWVKQLTNTGSLGGFTPNNSGNDEAQLRIDGFEDGEDPTIDIAMVQEIAPA